MTTPSGAEPPRISANDAVGMFTQAIKDALCAHGIAHSLDAPRCGDMNYRLIVPYRDDAARSSANLAGEMARKMREKGARTYRSVCVRVVEGGEQRPWPIVECSVDWGRGAPPAEPSSAAQEQLRQDLVRALGAKGWRVHGALATTPSGACQALPPMFSARLEATAFDTLAGLGASLVDKHARASAPHGGMLYARTLADGGNFVCALSKCQRSDGGSVATLWVLELAYSLAPPAHDWPIGQASAQHNIPPEVAGLTPAAVLTATVARDLSTRGMTRLATTDAAHPVLDTITVDVGHGAASVAGAAELVDRACNVMGARHSTVYVLSVIDDGTYMRACLCVVGPATPASTSSPVPAQAATPAMCAYRDALTAAVVSKLRDRWHERVLALAAGAGAVRHMEAAIDAVDQIGWDWDKLDVHAYGIVVPFDAEMAGAGQYTLEAAIVGTKIIFNAGWRAVVPATAPASAPASAQAACMDAPHTAMEDALERKLAELGCTRVPGDSSKIVGVYTVLYETGKLGINMAACRIESELPMGKRYALRMAGHEHSGCTFVVSWVGWGEA